MRHSLFLVMLTSNKPSKVHFTHSGFFFLSFFVFFARSHVGTGAIVNKFRGTGQTCICANRIYVQSSVYADFACRLAEKVAAFKVGDGLDEKTYYLCMCDC